MELHLLISMPRIFAKIIQKCLPQPSKSIKMAQNGARSKKEARKKEVTSPVLGEVRRSWRSPGNPRFFSGRLLPSPENKSKARQHSRRSAADCCSLTRGPPHSTTLLALADVQRIAQNLGGSCQNLERILAISDAILAAKWNCIC